MRNVILRIEIVYFGGDSSKIITEVYFKLIPKGQPTVEYANLKERLKETTLQSVRDTVLEIRKERSMVYNKNDINSHSTGCFFKNPIVSKNKVLEEMPSWEMPNNKVKLAAAWLIENSGFPKGYSWNNNVGLSQKHTLAIVNKGEATATEILDFAKHIQDTVKEKFDVSLEIEPILIS